MTDKHKKIDKILAHKIYGRLIFFFIIFIMFQATFYIGQFPMDLIERFVDIVRDAVATQMSDGILKDLIIDGVISGVGGVIVFLPNILILFLFISIMESSGYMARAAYLMDGIMRKVGLQEIGRAHF